MMRGPRRLWPRTIADQITGLVIVSLIVAEAAIFGILLLLPNDRDSPQGLLGVVGRIVTVAQLARAAGTPAEIAHLLDQARRTGVDVELMRRADLIPMPPHAPAKRLATRLSGIEKVMGMAVLAGAAPPDSAGDALVVELDADNALVFRSPQLGPLLDAKLARLITLPATFTLTIVIAFVMALSVYAGRWITSPPSSFAAAADAFGRSPGDDRVLAETGPREIVKVAHALNEMRARVRALVDSRTRMLAAIGHDLRTPLTRLRLRAERLDDPVRTSMLADITMIDAMLSETLAYLRDEVRTEPPARVELPSLLQTIAAEFSDIGHRVAYEGPDRFAYLCRPQALARALRNLVENGTKHGSEVVIRLTAAADDALAIEISDDGAGIPPAHREKVFEPFFKGDSARPAAARAGFGLGLSIARDTVRGHGGDIFLLDRAPHGLTVRIVLPGGALTGDRVASPSLELSGS
jgi:signal transduction histidine kinase